MNAEDVARYDQLKEANAGRTEQLQQMGFAPDPSKEVTLRLASMLEAVCERLECRAEADLRFEEIRSEELDILLPAAVQVIRDRQAAQEEAEHAQNAAKLGIVRR